VVTVPAVVLVLMSVLVLVLAVVVVAEVNRASGSDGARWLCGIGATMGAWKREWVCENECMSVL